MENEKKVITAWCGKCRRVVEMNNPVYSESVGARGLRGFNKGKCTVCSGNVCTIGAPKKKEVLVEGE